MKMNLYTLTENFSRGRGITLQHKQHGIFGRGNGFAVGYWNRLGEENLVVMKHFPPLVRINESSIVLKDDSHKPTLEIKILHGCLRDYIMLLNKTKDDFCRSVQHLLISNYIDSGKEEPKPEDTMRDTIPIGLPDHYPSINLLFDYLYPKLKNI